MFAFYCQKKHKASAKVRKIIEIKDKYSQESGKQAQKKSTSQPCDCEVEICLKDNY